MNPQFWKNKKVLLTGHTGFKGSWLALWLEKLEAEVTGYSLDVPSVPSLFELAGVDRGNITSIRADVCDFAGLKQAINDRRPEIVVHMAAQSLVRRSYINPIETYQTNVMGTVNVLEAVRQSEGVKAVVVVTSDKCYENREWVWGYRENDAMGGHDPYSNSKGCAELVTAAFRNSFFNSAKSDGEGSTAIASARAGNVIGGGDWAEDRLVPDLMRAVLEKRAVRIRNPNAVRPWQHVLDPLGGYLLLAEKLYEDGAKYAESWNFGPRSEDVRPVMWLVGRLTELWGNGASWKLDAGDHPHEARYLKLDCSKAQAQLNWRARWSAEQTLDAIIEWYKAYEAKQDMRSITLQQIAAYEGDLRREISKA